MSQIPIIEAKCFKNYPSIQFGMSTRLGGVSPAPLGMNLSFNVGDKETNVRKNRELFFGSLDIKLDELAMPGQVHSSEVKVVTEPGSYAECDALITNQQRVYLCVSVADCVPVFVFDQKRKVIAAIHAGWRGTAGKIAERSLEKMITEFSSDPSEVKAFVGPSASLCCYSVGEEVASQFDERFVHRLDGKIFIDLKSANVAQLVSNGIPESAIEVSPLCTVTESQLLHSFRRDKEKSGRMMGVIGII